MKYLQGFIIFFFVGLFLAVMVGPGDNYYRKKSEKVSFPIEVYLIFGLVGGIVGIGIGSSWEEQEKKKLFEEEETRKRLLFEEEERKKRWLIEEEERRKRVIIQEEVRLAKKIKIESLGVNRINDSEFKDGRKWVLETSWINPSTNNLNIIKTYFDKELNSTITSLNMVVLYNHNSNEGSHIFVSKHHSNYKGIIINKVIEGDLKTI